MRRRPFKIPAIARAAGYAAAAATIAATAFYFRHDDGGASAPPPVPWNESDPLARELARCQAIGIAAKDEAACEATWAENRRRFFIYRPVHSATTEQKPFAKPESGQ